MGCGVSITKGGRKEKKSSLNSPLSLTSSFSSLFLETERRGKGGNRNVYWHCVATDKLPSTNFLRNFLGLFLPSFPLPLSIFLARRSLPPRSPPPWYACMHCPSFLPSSVLEKRQRSPPPPFLHLSSERRPSPGLSSLPIDKRTYGKMSKVGPFPSSYSVLVCWHSASVGLGWGERGKGLSSRGIFKILILQHWG